MKLRDGKKYNNNFATVDAPKTEYVSRSRRFINVREGEHVTEKPALFSTTLPLDLSPTRVILDGGLMQIKAVSRNNFTKQENFLCDKVNMKSKKEGEQYFNEKSFSSSTVVTKHDIHQHKEGHKKMEKNIKFTSTPIPISLKSASENGLLQRKNQEVDFHHHSSSRITQSYKSIKNISLSDSLCCNEKLNVSDENVENSLEDKVFHDISFTKLTRLRNRTEMDHSFHKIDGSFFSDDDDDDDRDFLNTHHNIKHVKRSQYRQNRRDWYLNRRRYSEKTFFYRYFLRYVLIITSIITSIHKKVSRYVRRQTSTFKIIRQVRCYTSYHIYIHWMETIVKSLFSYHSLYSHILYCICLSKRYVGHFFSFIKFSLDSLLGGEAASSSKISKFATARQDDDNSAVVFCCWNCGVGLLCLLFFIPLLLFATTIFAGTELLLLPSPEESQMLNAYALFLNERGRKIPAWHVRPPSVQKLPIAKSFDNNLPAIIYLREEDIANSKQQKQIYQILSSLGYHVIVPIDVLGKDEVIVAWSWVKKKAINSHVYVWGNKFDSRVLTGYAKDFCNKLIPPSGVIIEVDKPTIHQHRNLEIWSCNCTLVPSPNKDANFSYNHVKCPLTFVEKEQLNIYDQVVSCIQAVTRGIKK